MYIVEKLTKEIKKKIYGGRQKRNYVGSQKH